MTFPRQPNPQQLLASQDWRLRNSWWVLPTLLCCGMATWASFLYIGMKTRTRAWLVAAGVYTVLLVGVIVLLELGGPSDTEVDAGAVRTATQQTIHEWTGGAIIAVWVAGIVHALLVRPHFLRKLALDAAPWWAKAGSHTVVHPHYGQAPPPAPWAPPTPIPPAPPAPPLPAPPLPAPPVSLNKQVPVNTATPAELAALGLSPAAVDAVLAARARPGGLRGVQEFAAASGVKPHELHALAPRLSFDPPPQAPPPFRAGGRRLDL